MKRYLAAIVALLLILSVSTTALAENGKGGGQSQQGGSSSQPPQSSPKPNSSGQGRESGKSNGPSNTGAPGANTDKIAETIAALDDETVQANLTSLLEAYETALAAKQTALDAKNTNDLAALSSAAGAAKEALDAALEEAGVSTDDLYGVPEEANDGTGRMQNRPSMDADEIATAIAALDDTDTNKATLTSLLNAYETALAAQSLADASSLTNEEQKALADAVQAAEQALLEATKAAGITGGVGRGQFVNGYGNAPMDTESVAAAIAALDDSNANKATLTNLLAAYEAARTAQTNADTASLTEGEIAALADATRTAEQALQEALKNAGLAEEPILEQNQRQIQTQTAQGGGATPSFELNVLEDGETSTDSESTGLFSAFLQWLSNLVK